MPKIKAGSKVSASRQEIYPEIEVKLCMGAKSISLDIAKEILGWQVVDKNTSEYHFVDDNGEKIVCHNNISNRPIYQTILATLKQEHLRKRWVVNGEPIIIGKTGLILNGQHSLISFVLCCQEWETNRDKWPEWKKCPTLEKVIVFGIDESDTVVNTMDTCKPRSLGDVIYRSEFFSDITKSKDRKIISRILDYAVKMLWHRTGADENAFAPRRTHSEALAFIEKHPKILECVKHIFEEDGDTKQISRYISTGYASGLLYLMGSCRSEKVEEYKENPREDILNWETWDDACDFWVKLASGDKGMKPLTEAFSKMVEITGGSRPERTALISKAWGLYISGKKMNTELLQLDYVANDMGFMELAESVPFGGIDMVNLLEHHSVDPTPEELEERASQIRKESSKKKSERSSKKTLKKKLKKESMDIGDTVYVLDDEGTWTGTLADVYDGPKGKVARVKTTSGKSFEVALDLCTGENPEIESD